MTTDYEAEMNKIALPCQRVFDRLVIEVATMFPAGLRTCFADALRAQSCHDKQSATVDVFALPYFSATSLRANAEGLTFREQALPSNHTRRPDEDQPLALNDREVNSRP